MRILFLITIILFNSCYGYSKTRYITTIHPFKEILAEIVGNRGEVHQILPPGASPHTYELRPSDIKKVETATALILGGENLDEWARKFQNPNRIELIELLPEDYLLHIFTDNNKENLTAEKKIDHHYHSGVDPHFWTDPITVKALVPILAAKLSEIDNEGKEIYRVNSTKFIAHLDSLYSTINQALEPDHGNTVMLSHPFFRYFLNRFGLKLVGLIEPIPGREPTPKEIKNMVELVKKEKVKAIFTHPQLADRAAKLVAEASGIKVFQLDPIGGVKGRETYDELLLYNLKILLEALR